MQWSASPILFYLFKIVDYKLLADGLDMAQSQANDTDLTHWLRIYFLRTIKKLFLRSHKKKSSSWPSKHSILRVQKKTPIFTFFCPQKHFPRDHQKNPSSHHDIAKILSITSAGPNLVAMRYSDDYASALARDYPEQTHHTHTITFM